MGRQPGGCWNQVQLYFTQNRTLPNLVIIQGADVEMKHNNFENELNSLRPGLGHFQREKGGRAVVNSRTVNVRYYYLLG